MEKKKPPPTDTRDGTHRPLPKKRPKKVLPKSDSPKTYSVIIPKSKRSRKLSFTTGEKSENSKKSDSSLVRNQIPIVQNQEK